MALRRNIHLEINGIDTAVVVPAPWDPSRTFVEFDLSAHARYECPANWSHSQMAQPSKMHTVTALTVLVVDDVLDTVSGTTDASFDVDVYYQGGYVTVTPDGGGNWDAVLPYDILPGDDVSAAQFDDDGDATWIYWQAP